MSAPGIEDEPAGWPVRRRVERFSGGVFAVRTDTVAMPGDDTAERDVVAHPGSVAVIALDEEGRVLVLQQYRHPVGRLLWEAPAGILDAPGEAPLRTAARELYEEAHQRASDWRVLVDSFTSPGMTDEATRVYLAQGLTEVAATERFVGVHEETDMPVAWVGLDLLVEHALAGRLHNPQLLLGVLSLRVVLDGAGLDSLRPGGAPWPERPTAG